jgi:hypothetical protein
VAVTVSSVIQFFCGPKGYSQQFFSKFHFALFKMPFALLSECQSFAAITKYWSCQNVINEGSDVQTTASSIQTPPLPSYGATCFKKQGSGDRVMAV